MRAGNVLSSFVQWCYDDGSVALGLVKASLQGFTERHWTLRGKIRIAWSAVASWEQGEPVDMRDPIPKLVFYREVSFSGGPGPRQYLYFWASPLFLSDGPDRNLF